MRIYIIYNKAILIFILLSFFFINKTYSNEKIKSTSIKILDKDLISDINKNSHNNKSKWAIIDVKKIIKKNAKTEIISNLLRKDKSDMKNTMGKILISQNKFQLNKHLKEAANIQRLMDMKLVAFNTNIYNYIKQKAIVLLQNNKYDIIILISGEYVVDVLHKKKKLSYYYINSNTIESLDPLNIGFYAIHNAYNEIYDDFNK